MPSSIVSRASCPRSRDGLQLAFASSYAKPWLSPGCAGSNCARPSTRALCSHAFALRTRPSSVQPRAVLGSTEIYDYVVVGGGSAGCVVAGQLARELPEAKILVLEAGDHAEQNSETLRSDGYGRAFANDRLMWARHSLPQPALGGRRIYLGTGRGVGGSAGVNAMVYLRGAQSDFDGWNIEGWRWKDVVPEFEAIESQLQISRYPPSQFGEACIDAATEVGFTRSEDLNDGNWCERLGYEWMNFSGPWRRNSYVCYVKPIRHERPGLDIQTGAHVTRVCFDGEKRACAVEFIAGGTSTVHKVSVRREVILTGGALETPRLLMQSGVGPGPELRTHGIECVADIDAVGRNLQDHPNVTLFFRSRAPIDGMCPQVYGFGRAGQEQARGRADTCFVMYPARSSLALAMKRMLPALALPGTLPPGDAGLRARGRRVVARGVDGVFALGGVQRFVERLWGIVVILGKPVSRGRVVLAPSQHPLAPAAGVEPGYLSQDSDLDTMLAGIARARAIASSRAATELGAKELSPGWLGHSAAGMHAWLKANLMTTYHFGGTCRMGSDPESVVDTQLRVRGVQGLRIADASIMPEVPVGALNAPSMLIGAKAAKLIMSA